MSALIGLADLNRKLAALGDPRETRNILRSAVRAGMAKVLKEARNRIPVGTEAHKTYKGRLVAPGFARRSLKVVTQISRDGTAQALLGVKREAFYATQFLELGTAKLARRPFLVPSLQAKQEEAIQAIADQMKKRIDKVARS